MENNEDKTVLDSLVQQGILSEDQVKEERSKLVTKDLAHLTTELHALICQREHGIGGCLWYLEEEGEESWVHAAHKRWVLISRDVCEAMNRDPREVQGIFARTLTYIENWKPQEKQALYVILSLTSADLLPLFKFGTEKQDKSNNLKEN